MENKTSLLKERTLVLVKPDGVKRGLAGEVLKRFEQRGLKIIGLKLVWIDDKFAKRHYTEEIGKKHGMDVWKRLVDYIKEKLEQLMKQLLIVL